MPSAELLSAFRTAAEEAALRAAEIVEGWRSRFQIREKGYADLVTDADHASQKAIQSFLLERFPDHDFMGEEQTYGPNGPRLAEGAPPTWIVDPIDGTSNYAHDVPAYCISIGLWAEGDLCVGIIYDPRQKEMFSSATGAGATLNGKPLRVSAIDAIGSSLLSTGFPSSPTKQERNLQWWRKLSYSAQGLRRTGSTALNLAYVAAGRFDAYWAFDNNPWDMAAGIVLVREAGGAVSRVSGAICDVCEPDLLATNGHLHPPLLAIFQGTPDLA